MTEAASMGFALEAEAASERASDLPVVLVWSGLAAIAASMIFGGAAMVVLSGGRWGITVAVLIGLGFVLLSTLVWGIRWTRRRYTVRMTLGARGVTLDRADGESRLLSWTDPAFGFELLDYTTLRPPVKGVTPKVHPYRVLFRGGWAAATDIPEEAVYALLDAAKARGVTVEHTRLQSGPLKDVTRYAVSASGS